MSFEFVSTEEAIAASGLRMVVVGNVPSPWGEAAKGILHMKGLNFKAVVLDAADEAQLAWSGSKSAPALIVDDEPARTGWAEIALLAERLAPQPSLIPSDAADRALVFGLAHELLGEEGLAWSRRLQLIDIGLTGKGGFPEKASHYLAGKYGHSPARAAAAVTRVIALLGMLADRLKAQKAAGSDYYVGTAPSIADICSATTLALFSPLPEDICAMRETTRAAFETGHAAVDAALDPVLIAHRDMMYERHLALPLML